MTIDIDALQALEGEEQEALGLCGWTCSWTCAWTSDQV